jgi:hypothetical protein
MSNLGVHAYSACALACTPVWSVRSRLQVHARLAPVKQVLRASAWDLTSVERSHRQEEELHTPKRSRAADGIWGLPADEWLRKQCAADAEHRTTASTATPP